MAYSQQQMDEINRKIMDAEKTILEIVDTHNVHPGDIILRIANTINIHEQEKYKAAALEQFQKKQAEEQINADLEKIKEEVENKVPGEEEDGN